MKYMHSCEKQAPLRHKAMAGQVGIILLLIVVVMSTLAISVVSRTNLDVNQSKTAEDANRTLDAAESGVEQALSNTNAINPDLQGYEQSVTSIPNIAVNYTVDKLQLLETTVDFGYVAGVNVTGAANGNTLDVNWSKEASCSDTVASLVITIYNQVGTDTPTIRRVFAGGCDHTPTDGFTLAGNGTVAGYLRHVSVPLAANDVLVRIRPVYAGTALRVAGGGGFTLPVQQYKVQSTAQNTKGQETKAVEVERSLSMPPATFDYVLYSGTSITQ